MFNKIKWMTGIWLAVIFSYLTMAASMGAIRDICTASVAEMTATSNLTALPGIEESISAFPTYCWAIPALVGTIGSIIILKGDKDNE